MASEGAVGTAYFPCRSGGQLDFRWGLGRELLLAETSGRTQATECNFGGAQWSVMTSASVRMSRLPSAIHCFCRDEPSSAQRQVAYDTMKLHKALHTQAMSGETCSFAWPYLELVTKTSLSMCCRARQSSTTAKHYRVQPRSCISFAGSMRQVRLSHTCLISNAQIMTLTTSLTQNESYLEVQ